MMKKTNLFMRIFVGVLAVAVVGFIVYSCVDRILVLKDREKNVYSYGTFEVHFTEPITLDPDNYLLADLKDTNAYAARIEVKNTSDELVNIYFRVKSKSFESIQFEPDIEKPHAKAYPGETVEFPVVFYAKESIPIETVESEIRKQVFEYEYAHMGPNDDVIETDSFKYDF